MNKNLKNVHNLSLEEWQSLPSFFKASERTIVTFRNVRRQPFHQKYFVCELLKEDGNTHYKSDCVDAALESYGQALSIFICCIPTYKSSNCNENGEGSYFELEIEEGNSEKERTLCKRMKINLYTNLSQCYLRREDFLNAYHAADNALAIQPDHWKALFRRAKASISLKEPQLECLKQAVRDLKQTWKLAPDERPFIKKAMEEAARKLELFRKKEIPSMERYSSNSTARRPRKRVKRKSVEGESTANWSLKEISVNKDERQSKVVFESHRKKSNETKIHSEFKCIYENGSFEFDFELIEGESDCLLGDYAAKGFRLMSRIEALLHK